MLKRVFKNNLYHFPSWSKIPKWIRGIIVILLSFIFLLLVLYGFLAWYVNGNKKALIRQLSGVVAENLNGGKLAIRDIDVAFWKTFPSVSIHIKDLTLCDSMYAVHHKYLFDFKNVYVRLKPLSLLGSKPQISKVFVANGSIYMFKDSSNYSNLSVFKTTPKADKQKKESALNISDYNIENVNFVFDNFYKNKRFDILINEIDGTLNTIENIINIDLDLDANVVQLGFNLAKGGFLKNTSLKAPLKIKFIKDLNRLETTEQKILANGMPIILSAEFNFASNNKSYSLLIDGKKLDFAKSRAMLSDHISKKLSVVEILKPVDVTASIKGFLIYPDTPRVIVHYTLNNNTIKVPIGDIAKVNVSGSFTNEFLPNKGLGNSNSVILIDKFKGEFEGVPVVLDSSYVLDFALPKIYCKIKSSFPVEKLDDLAGSSFNLRKGVADIDLLYSGPMTPNDTFERSMSGFIVIKDASMTYLPRKLKFDRCNATIIFKGQDVEFKKVELSSKSSKIHLDGIGKQFLSAYFNDQYKAHFDLNINSEQINLNEFKSLLVARKSSSSAVSSAKFKKMNNQLDQALGLSDMLLDIKIGKLTYNKVVATNIKANLDLLASGIALRNVHVNHANGSIQLNGTVNQSVKNNPFKAQVNINNVNVSELFSEFENFGLTALTHENIKGSFTGNINISGGLDEQGNLMHRSMTGIIDFKLRNGALVNFPPLLQVQKYAFKGRNLSNVTFQELKNKLILDKGIVTIPPMEIVSSAIYMRVQGVYGLDKGTDIAIEVPLRNPKKDEALIAQGKDVNRMKGLVVNLRAQDDENGKVKIIWDPRKKGVKENELRMMENGDAHVQEDAKKEVAEPKSEKKKWWQR